MPISFDMTPATMKQNPKKPQNRAPTLGIGLLNISPS
jgi:hypothetical protein